MNTEKYRIIKAEHINDYVLKIYFGDGEVKEIDFKKPFDKYVKGYYEKYHKLSLFKKFTVSGGQLFWGKNWDVIFPTPDIRNEKLI